MSAMILVVVAVVAGLWAAGKLLRTGGWWTIIGWKYRALGWALTLAALVVLALLVWAAPWWVQLLAVPVLVWLVARPVLRRARSSSVIGRWADRARRTHGVATSWDIARGGSGWAVKRKASQMRPSLAQLGRVERARVPAREVGVRLARVGRQHVWSPAEDVITVFGGPRRGKTGWLGGVILDAPGAAVCTSTRLDIVHATQHLRRRRGPTYVFNPADLGRVPNSIAFDPVAGCHDPVVAIERAHDMIPERETASGEREHWDAKARQTLGSLMHAAALDGRTARDVQRWIADTDRAKTEIFRALESSPESGLADAVEQFLGTNTTTRTSITSTVQLALAWVSSSSALASTHQGRALDVAELLAERGTVYLLGRHETYTAALLAALTGHVARTARRLAADQPGGRLDPWLLMALDEVARTAPVPLPDWTGDFGGSGICIIPVLQSRADLIDRWGSTGCAKILNNSGSIMLYGGTKDEHDLRFWSHLGGDHEMTVTSTDARGKTTGKTSRPTQVLAPAQLANLPAGQVVVWRSGMSPAIGHTQMSWRRRDVRAAQRAARRAVTQPAPATGWAAQPAESTHV